MSDESLAHAFELTMEIKAAAIAHDWLRASSLAEARSPLLMALSPAQTPDGLVTIRAIQTVDATIAEYFKSEQDTLANQLRDSMKRIEAASFYQMTGKIR